MALIITCPSCSRELRVPDELSGKNVKCPLCGTKFLAPMPEAGRPPAVPSQEEKSSQRIQPSPSGPGWKDEPSREPPRGSGRRRAVPTDEDDEEDFPEEEEPPLRRRRRSREADLMPTDLDALREEAARLKQQRSLFQLLSFAFGLPGLVAVIAAAFLQAPTSLLVVLAGAVLLWVGIAFGVAYKRYNLAWVLLGLLGVIGLIVLALIPDEKGKRLRRIGRMLGAEEEWQRPPRRPGPPLKKDEEERAEAYAEEASLGPPAHAPEEMNEEAPPRRRRGLSSDYSIDVSEWFEYAKAHYGSILGPMIGYMFIYGLLTGIPYLGALVALVIGAPLEAGFVAVGLAQLKGKRWSFGDFFSGFNRYGALMGNFYLRALIAWGCLLPGAIFVLIAAASKNDALVIVGIVVSIVCFLAMIYVTIRATFFNVPLIIDRNYGPIEAIQASWTLSRGHFWGLFGVGLLLAVIGVAGILLCFVGVLFTTPFAVLAYCAGYLLIAGTRPPRESPSAW